MDPMGKGLMFVWCLLKFHAFVSIQTQHLSLTPSTNQHQNDELYTFLVGGFNPSEKYAEVKLGEFLPQFYGVKIPNIFELPPSRWQILGDRGITI